MKKIFAVTAIICLGFGSSYAQKPVQKQKAHKHRTTSSANANIVPQWQPAAHADAAKKSYSPDYYSYYDGQRGGYVTWENGQESFTPAVSPYPERLNDGKTSLRLSKAFSLDLQPELDYPYYMTQYPVVRDGGNSRIPVPAEGNPAQR